MQVFPFEFCQISKNTFFTEHLCTTDLNQWVSIVNFELNLGTRYTLKEIIGYKVYIKGIKLTWKGIRHKNFSVRNKLIKYGDHFNTKSSVRIFCWRCISSSQDDTAIETVYFGDIYFQFRFSKERSINKY